MIHISNTLGGDWTLCGITFTPDLKRTRSALQATCPDCREVAKLNDEDASRRAASTAPRRCAKCGLAENEHDVRHVFVPAGGRR